MTVVLLAYLALGTMPFEFHNGFWTNLHHFLLQQSIETTEGESLPAEEKAAWDGAVRFYRERFAGKNVLSPEMAKIKNAIEDHDGEATPAPAYRAHWWTQHSKANADWIAAETPLVEENASARIVVPSAEPRT